MILALGLDCFYCCLCAAYTGVIVLSTVVLNQFHNVLFYELYSINCAIQLTIMKINLLKPRQFPFFKPLLTSILLCASVAHTSLFAFEKNKVTTETGFYKPSVLLEAAVGSDMSHYELGLDFQQDVALGFGGLYLSRDQYDVHGFEQDATMTAIGIRGLQFSSQAEDLIGVDLHLGLNRTKVDSYSRTGFEIAMTFYENVSENTSILLGLAFRPEFLSFDWSGDIATEFGFEVGVNYNIANTFNLFSKYYYESLVNEDFDTGLIDDGILFGATYIF